MLHSLEIPSYSLFLITLLVNVQRSLYILHNLDSGSKLIHDQVSPTELPVLLFRYVPTHLEHTRLFQGLYRVGCMCLQPLFN